MLIFGCPQSFAFALLAMANEDLALLRCESGAAVAHFS